VGDVISQNPVACTACVPPLSTVDLVVSLGPAPTVSIIEPVDGAIFSTDTEITFTGTASDVEEGDLSANLVWTSNKDGVLGSGSSVTTTLSKGRHKIIATVTDITGLSGSDEIKVRIRR
jgi:beta-lactam-binding protein with PASTA domain